MHTTIWDIDLTSLFEIFHERSIQNAILLPASPTSHLFPLSALSRLHILHFKFCLLPISLAKTLSFHFPLSLFRAVRLVYLTKHIINVGNCVFDAYKMMNIMCAP